MSGDYNWFDLSWAVKPIANLPLPPTPAKGAPALMPYQVAAAQQTFARRHTYCGHHPGKGKTAIALVASMVHSPTELVVCICPPGLVAKQWGVQALRWTGLPWYVADTGDKVRTFFARPNLPARVIVPDSLVDAIPALNRRIATLIVDEAHRAKSRDAKRTRSIFGFSVNPGLAGYADRIIALSGTPMPNNPVELYPFLKASDPAFAGRFSDYCNRFCPPIRLYVGGAFRDVFNRATNYDQLSHHLRSTSLIRPRLSDYEDQLPPVIEETYAIKTPFSSSTASVESIMQTLEKGGASSENESLSRERRTLGEAKAGIVVDVLRVLCEGGDTPVIFCWHKSVADALGRELQIPVIHSGVSADDRARAVQSFVNKEAPAIVCTIMAAGTGIDGLQHRSNLICFVERDYVPANIEQPIGRVLRMGQSRGVRVISFTSDHPIDRAIEGILTRKKRIIADTTE